MDRQLIINDELIEISDKTIVAITIQSLDIQDITKRSVSRTNAIKVPRTKANLIKLGFLDNEHSATLVPYRKYPARFIENGFTKINGYAYIRSVDEYIQLAIYDNAFDIFNALKGLNVNQLHYMPTVVAWDNAGIDAARLNTSGWVSPAIDWGKMDSGTFVQPAFYMPSFFYWEMVLRSLEAAGAYPIGDIFISDYFKNLIVPFSADAWEYPEQFVQDFSFVATAKAGTIPPYSGASQISAAWDVTGNFRGYWDKTQSWLTPNALYTPGLGFDFIQFDIRTFFHFEIVGATGNTAKVEIVKLKDGVETVLTTYEITMPGAPANNGDVDIEALAVPLEYLDKVYLKYTPTLGSPTITISGWQIEGTAKNIVYDKHVFMNYFLPDLEMIDLIKDCWVRFGLIDKVVGNTLIVKTLDAIIKDRAGAVDWSQKRVDQMEIDFAMDYAQNNYFESEDNTKIQLGRGNIPIDNDQLEEENTLYDSPFGNATTSSFLWITLAKVEMFDEESITKADSESPGLRLLYMRPRRAPEPEMGFGGDATFDYNVAIYQQTGEPIDASFIYTVKTYYPRVAAALQRIKGITRTYNLNDSDIANFDKHKLIWDDGYFLVLKIHNFVTGQRTKVELLKVD